MMRQVEYLFVRLLLGILGLMSYAASIRLSRTIAHLAYLFDGTPRSRALANLRLAYGAALPQRKAESIARGVFETMSSHVAEVAHATRQAGVGLVVENGELLTRAYALGKGVVVVSAHMGCWIRMAVLPRLLGLKVAVIMKKQRNSTLLDWGIGYLKRHFDLEVIVKTDARERAVQLLKEGSVVTFFADQHPRKGGFPARFFGRDIMAASGPAVYAKHFRCTLLVVTAVQRGDGTHVLRFEGPLPTGGTHDEISQRWLDLLEARIREYPEQWMWMHRRWRGAAAIA